MQKKSFQMKTCMLPSIAVCLMGLFNLEPATAQCLLFKWEPGTSPLDPRNCIDLINEPGSEDFKQRSKLKIDVVRKQDSKPAYTPTPPPPPGPDISLEPIECAEPVPEPGFPPFPAEIDLPVPLMSLKKEKTSVPSAREAFSIQAPEPARTVVYPGECEENLGN